MGFLLVPISMSLNDHNHHSLSSYIEFSKACCVEVNKDSLDRTIVPG